MPPDRLIFVYNADSGFFNALMDSAHKALSPATYPCSLCQLTYGMTSMVPQWKAFLESLGVPVVFLHRNELRRENPGVVLELPTMLVEREGQREVLLSAKVINATGSLDDLISRTRDRLAEIAQRPGA